MTITKSTINKNYQELLRQNSGAEFVRVDLHVHTPASGDAQAKNKYNFKFDIRDIPTSLDSAKQIAAEIVDGAMRKGIRLIAVTDHNSPGNTHPEDLTNTWYQLLKDKARGKELTVLPGVEISTDDLHILVILDPREDEPAAYTTHRINFLLQDCRFSLKEYGNYRATGMSSLFDVLQYIEDLSTSCIAIPAHIDGGKKAMLAVYRGPSNVFNKLLNHPNLNAVEVVKDTTPARKRIGKKSVMDYFESLRDENRSPIAFIQDSDGHAIGEIGKRFTYIRMGKPDFWSLKNALENPETRIRMQSDYKPDEGKTRIIGIAFSTGKKWSYIAFNSNLNCIIGKKRTGKSTIIDLVLYGLDRLKDGNINEEEGLIKKKYRVNVFIAKDSEVICYSRGEEDNPPSIFKYRDGSFTLTGDKPDMELPRKYNHEAIEKLFSQSTNLMDFLDRHVFANKEIQSYVNNRNKYLEKVRNRNFKNCASDMEQLAKACQQLFDERKKRTKPALEKYGKNLFKVRITKGKWRGRRERDFFDKATISLLIDSKYRSWTGLSTGEKNAAMMVLLMNQGAFGPLIIDEPEQYLDVKSVTGMLIPRMRKLKTRQQIICVTRDEHILVSGDAEQVIATQSEKKLEVTTGDINNREIQKHILEIFEGDRLALLAKSRKLGRILE
jgi:PHP family Zn ribbon phosphoesterase/ABC-type enterochelin transport system ATPase subunit